MRELNFDIEIVEGWRKRPLEERVAANVENLHRCVIPWEQMLERVAADGPGRRVPLVFTHVKKTGGTTFQHVLSANYSPYRILHVNAPTLYDHPGVLHKLATGEPSRQQSPFFVVMGHHKYKDVLYSLLQPHFVHVTMIRDPVQRVVSHYRAARSHPRNPVHDRAIAMTLSEFVEANPSMECQDAQTHRLAGTLDRKLLAELRDPASTLEAARENLLRTMSWFGLTEAFDEFLLVCQRLLGWRQVLYLRHNVTTPSEPIPIGDDDIACVREHNRLDLELYEFAVRVFRERQARLGIGEQDLREHRRALAVFASLMQDPEAQAGGHGPAIEEGRAHPPLDAPVPTPPAAQPRRARAPERAPPPLVITGRFRSGTTLLWQMFDRSPRHTAYYEPCHDNLLPQILHGRPLESHKGVSSYWNAYLPILDTVRELHRPAFGYERLLLEADEEHPELEAWLTALVEAAAPRQAVLKLNRFDFRLPWLRARFPEAVVLHMVRDPREAWASMVRHLPRDEMDDPDHLDVYDLLQWATSLAEELPVLVGSLADSSYARHYLLWRLSRWMGRRQADASISFDDDLQADPEAGLAVLGRIEALDEAGLAASRALIQTVPTKRWSAWHPEEYFRDIEVRCDEELHALGLAERFGLESLPQIRRGNPEAWEAATVGRRGAPVLPTLAACSALRAEITRLLPLARQVPQDPAQAGAALA